ncbi:nitroreductase family protein [Derxia lacustris]|uniref:nitroreductase family protein n=1 Tax=Derxia lacustris TaxID=764842 RepID=UPI000A16FE7F|nr:nitroreductase family protein [Derxia lacustris]
MTDALRTPEHPIDPLFTNRWSPRAFTGEPIPEAQLLSLIEAARWAPSAYNAQPWRFVYALRDTPEWAPILDGLVEFNQGWAQRASALVVVVSRTVSVSPGATEAKPNPWHAFDTGAAWASLAFQATLAGWYTHAMAGFDATRLAANIGVPPDHAIQAVVAIGRPGDKSVLPEGLQAREQPSPRQPFASIAAKGKFGFGG